MNQSPSGASKLQSPARRVTSFEPIVATVFGEVIRAERVKRSMAQDEFALMANIDRSYYGKLERGQRQPSLALILRIAAGLGTSASEILALVEKRLTTQN